MKHVFEGVFTALITPFTAENTIDYPCLKKLIERQIEAGVDGLVIMGTSGESPVIYGEEMKQLINAVLEYADGNIHVAVGTGNNDTAHTIVETKIVSKMGVDGLMLVNPYYNKPTQEGLFYHFSRVAKETHLPIMLYNIQGRTAVNLEAETLINLIDTTTNIVSVKEASGNLVQMGMILRNIPSSFTVMSGDDSLTLPLLAMGGRGVVSVIANLVPEVPVKLVAAIKRGDWDRARKIHKRWLPLMEALLTVGNNPLAVKTLLSELDIAPPYVRLPLYPLGEEERKKLLEVLEDCEDYDCG